MLVRLSEITVDLLEKVTKVWAVAADGQQQPRLVWDSQRVPHPRARFIGAPLTVVASVEVPSLSDEDLEPLYAKLEEVDPVGTKRLLRN